MSFVSFNVGNFVTLRLKPKNYPLWHEQVLAIVESQGLTGFVTGESQPPTVILIATDNSITTPNP